MAISGSQLAYLSARSGIARSGASRSNYVFPELPGFVTVGGVNLTSQIRYGSLVVSMAINDQPDTCSFEAFITDAATQAALVVGADVLIGLGGPTSNALFGGRIVTAQTTRNPAHIAPLCSVVCTDYLQALDSEYLITYGWPAQSATTTILDLCARFANHAGGVVLSTGAVQLGLPSHQAFGVENERFSTVLRRMVIMFQTPGGFYVDPLKVLHVWAGASEPGQTNPTSLTLTNAHLKQFSLRSDGSQLRDAVIVEGQRTTAPIGTPAAGDYAASPISFPVEDASILDKVHDQPGREIRVGSQRYLMRYAIGPWSPFTVGQPTTAHVSSDTLWGPPFTGSESVIVVDDTTFLNGRGNGSWILMNGQYLQVRFGAGTANLTVGKGGFGGLTAPAKVGDVIAVVDSLGGGTLTGRYDAPGKPEIVRAQPIDADVVMTVRSTAAPALHENIVQDGRYVRTGATNRGTHEVNDFKLPAVQIQFETTDLNATPGRLQAYSFADPGLAVVSGSYQIISTEISWPVWGELPRRVCTAANVEAADIVDAWVVDPR